MVTPDRKVRKLMEEYQRTGKLTTASLRSDLDAKTARKYLRAGKRPSQMRSEHTWRTRPDPFAGYWEEARDMLEDAPELEAKILFEWLCEQHPDTYQEGQVRTFQRRVREWRALSGPSQEVYFPQEHPPGVRMSTDFTWMNALAVTIGGCPFPHLLCHSVLCYSNWQWASVCHSESMLALRKGVQAALFRLGRIPAEHWTDHSTAATHAIGEDREFNQKYQDWMDHFGITPRTIQVEKPHENGDVESANGVLKRRIEQHLLLRGHRDFDGVDEYEAFIAGIMEKANKLRTKRLAEELSVMRLLDVKLLPEYRPEEPRVTSWSTVQVDRNTYSVPSRLKRRKVQARVYEDRVEIYYLGVHQLSAPRLPGECKHAINYRHVIDSLVRKPGAFRNYKYRSDMFPTEVFRWAYDVLNEHCNARVADMEYVRILSHAAKTMETSVAGALCRLRDRGAVPRWDLVEHICPRQRPDRPDMPVLEVNLGDYDLLLRGKAVA
ncbi:IS21 family transposase [Verrucomicrobiota bacterium]